ncbi:MAG: 23S rRNA (uracil(1939)-C(5))-methyltransferase RlmD [Vicinamibacteria bacterium]|nr:23S rRNA (uracil(1939)-C(5))-methyltransferase RlmD [Vicinamibacteria bacterium]
MSAGAARCRHAEACGGCPLQHVPYAEQLQRKGAQVQRLLDAALGPRAPRVRPVLPTPHACGDAPWEFRQKASFTFGTGQDGSLVMGHYSRGGDVVVPIAECPVHPARANRIAFAFRDAFVRAGLRAFGDDGRGLLRHLIVRTSAHQREAIAVLVVARHDRGLRAPLRAVMAGPDAPDGLLLNLHDRPGPYLLGRETLHLGGAEQVTETVLGEVFAVAPTSFFQTNVAAAGELVRLVLAATPAEGPLLDLYSGSGLFALPLARRASRVTAVEENRDAVRDARANLAESGLPESRLRVRAGRVEDVLPGLAHERFAAVVLDPPRQGASARVLSLVFETLRAPRVVFVSCNPEALAAELAFAARAGYRIGEVQPVDMFPHTDHVEAVAYADVETTGVASPPRRGDGRTGRRDGRGPRRR